ncbi:MAG: GntR family transcriptional regulator [Acidobacteria bacterium]|nr:GntR family transcriptional regulator [Acidobacteriota bacterium]
MINNVNVTSVVRPLKTSSLRVQVVDALREAIFSGKLQPGDPIREVHMARALQVSQPTVREALLQLEHAGLVVRTPQRDTVVTRLTAADIQERSHLRVLLEGEAGVAALEYLGDDELDELQAHLTAIHRALKRDSYHDFVAADLEFHRCIWTLSHNRTLCQMLELITVPLFAFLSIRRSRKLKDLIHVVHSHDPIVDALRSRKADKIREAFREHIEGSYSSFNDDGAAVPKRPRPKSMRGVS